MHRTVPSTSEMRAGEMQNEYANHVQSVDTLCTSSLYIESVPVALPQLNRDGKWWLPSLPCFPRNSIASTDSKRTGPTKRLELQHAVPTLRIHLSPRCPHYKPMIIQGLVHRVSIMCLELLRGWILHTSPSVFLHCSMKNRRGHLDYHGANAYCNRGLPVPPGHERHKDR